MDDSELLQRFEDKSLPFEQWTHRTHIRVAFCYLNRLGYEAGLQRIRAGIQAYNAVHHVPESPTTGYNETTTVAFARLVHATMCAYGAITPTPDSEAFCEAHPQLLQKHVLRLFYSASRRMHPDAKTCFVEPDLAPLPDASRAEISSR